MRPLDRLAHEAQRLAEGGVSVATRAGVAESASATGTPGSAAGRSVPGATPEDEVARQLQICNACRYCEGFCAVFPAMTRRLEFPKADVHYLANLCHNCGACLHACQYAPPHEFAVNVPRAMAEVRVRTWSEFAWPARFGRLYAHNGTTLAVALGIGLALFLALAVVLHGGLAVPPEPTGAAGAASTATAGAASTGAVGRAQTGGPAIPGDFYAVFPHGLMVWLFTPVFVFACVALGIGVARFWRLESPGDVSAAAIAEANGNALRLTYLDGGHGEGCNEADDRFTLSRRRYHHLTFYGFLLCFAATVVGTIYHYAFGWRAPYGYASLPVVLGTVGGVGLVAGPAGLLWLHLRRHPLHVDPAQKAMDRGLIALLFLTSVSGLALLAWRETAAMALLLAVHLGFVMAFFLTMPYGKFAHGVYRAAALLKWSIERRQPSRLTLGPE